MISLYIFLMTINAFLNTVDTISILENNLPTKYQLTNFIAHVCTPSCTFLVKVTCSEIAIRL